MSRRKKPEGETDNEARIRRTFESIADNATRGEKVSWERKMDNMVSILAKLRPIEDQIQDLMGQKQPILDEINELRKEMVRDCVHPYTHLATQADGTINCKFCNKVFVVKDQ